MSIALLFRLGLVGGGAIGSWLAAELDAAAVAVVFADAQRVDPCNLHIAAYTPADVGGRKADILAARHRERGGRAWPLDGDVRYTLRPGLARALDMAILCLDNPTAIRDAAESLWAAGAAHLPVMMLTCGADEGSYLVRLFTSPGLCPVCLFGNAERDADRMGIGTSCAAAAAALSAPRASAPAAAAAAAAGAQLLARWQAGDRSPAGCRIQRDAGGAAFRAQMPAAPLPRCPVAHAGTAADTGPARVALGGPIGRLAVASLAQAAIDHAGADASIALGRRAVPHAGLYCPSCHATATAPPLLLPAAQAAWRACRCGAAPRALGECNTLAAERLLEPEVADLTLAAWGAGHGDEFVATGTRGAVRLCCTFDWSELHDG